MNLRSAGGMNLHNPKRREIGVIRNPQFGVVDPGLPSVALTFVVDCGMSAAVASLPPDRAVALLEEGGCTVAGLEGRYCLVNFEHGYIVFERLLTQEEVLEAVNQLLRRGEIRHGPLADEGVSA